MGKTSIKMKVFQIFLLTAMVAVAMEKCVAEYLLVEIEDGPKPMPKPKPEPEPEPMPKKDLATRSIGLCTSYTTIINNCIEATQLQDCCDRYNVKEKAEDCWDVLCEDKSISCANEPWVFFEQFPKKGCDQHAKNIKSCCNL